MIIVSTMNIIGNIYISFFFLQRNRTEIKRKVNETGGGTKGWFPVDQLKEGVGLEILVSTFTEWRKMRRHLTFVPTGSNLILHLSFSGDGWKTESWKNGTKMGKHRATYLNVSDGNNYAFHWGPSILTSLWHKLLLLNSVVQLWTSQAMLRTKLWVTKLMRREISGQNCLSMHDIIKVLYLCAKKNVYRQIISASNNFNGSQWFLWESLFS